MKAVFVESNEFTEWVSEFLPGDSYAALQQELMDNPTRGTPMPGCGGLRKLRIPDPTRGKGKRGGARLIYLHLPEVHRFYLITIYGKDQKDDLSAADKKLYRQLAQVLKTEARRTRSS